MLLHQSPSIVDSKSISTKYHNAQHLLSLPLRFTILIILSLVCLSSQGGTVDAGLSVRVNATTTVNYLSWDPFVGESKYYSIQGILLLGKVQTDCTVQIDPAIGPSGHAIIAAYGSQFPITDTILLIGYDWLNYCATYDDIFYNIGLTNAQLQNMTLPTIGAIVMDGDANSNANFGSPFTQLDNAKHWNTDVRLNISFMGSDDFGFLQNIVETQALLATVVQVRGPWNDMWHSIGFNIVIRALDVFAGVTFMYGIWVLVFIAKAKQEKQHYRRYFTLIPGCIYLPLSIAFAPYKVTLPWRNAVYYFSLFLPFISLGLQIIMWGTLIYRIHRKPVNKFFAYYSYITIGVPAISAFLDGIGWLIPTVPIIRIIGERGFFYATPAVILIQAVVIFYYAATFFKSLKGVAISQTTRTALIKITVLNLAMISFFILMLLSRIVSLLGLDMRSISAYITELVVFRFSFLFFYACCFRTLSIRQPTGSTMDSKAASSAGANYSNGAVKHPSKNHTHYHMDDMSRDSSSKSGSQSQGDYETNSGMHYNKHLSNHASKGFTIADPSNYGSGDAAGGVILSPRLPEGFTSKHQLLDVNATDYPDPYKFDEFGRLEGQAGGEFPSSASAGTFGDSYIDIGEIEEEDKDSVYGSHRFHNLTPKSSAGNGGRVVGGREKNSEGYTRFDVSDEGRDEHATRPEEVDNFINILETAAEWLFANNIVQWPPGSFRHEDSRAQILKAIAEKQCFMIDYHPSEIKDGNSSVSQGENNDNIAGLFVINYENSFDEELWKGFAEDWKDALYLHRLVLRKPYQGVGLTPKIIEFVETKVKEAGRHYLRLDCLARNAALRKFYREKCRGPEKGGLKELSTTWNSELELEFARFEIQVAPK
ncbi:hypothetical protein BGZ49_009183 [Haplosporangium sp. Z 27]|nr:hypothetical protein BGZ49_009183 [Haplosporangium sp. Z 27]